MDSGEQDWRQFLQSCWKLAFPKARCPVKGVVLPDDVAQSILSGVFRTVGRQFEPDSDHGEVTAFILKKVREEAMATVAEQRSLSGEPDRFRDKGAQSYDYGSNPDFAQLKARDKSGILNSPELTRLFSTLRPIAINTFRKYHISERDGEEVFSMCLQKLTTPKKEGAQALIEELTLFEEVFPFFNKLVQNEAVDRVRRITTLKNQANVQDSVEALEDSERSPVQFADPASLGGDEMPAFDEIHALCAESLNALEWKLVTAVYIDGVTKNDLMNNDDLMADLGLSTASKITRWRGVTKRLSAALSKMRSRLEEDCYFFGNVAPNTAVEET